MNQSINKLQSLTMVGAWIALLTLVWSARASADTNPVYSPCTDTTIQRQDGFTLGLTFSSRDNFFFNRTQLSPCDSRLQLSTVGAQLALFRPKVDEITVFTLDNTSIHLSKTAVYMVAFAGNKYAATSIPTFVADAARVVTNFTLVMEFEKGILRNLYWYKFGCEECEAEECVEQQDCAVEASKCEGGAECNVGINVMFSGTDKHHKVLTSWYAIDGLREYSLFGMYDTLRNRITNLF